MKLSLEDFEYYKIIAFWQKIPMLGRLFVYIEKGSYIDRNHEASKGPSRED